VVNVQNSRFFRRPARKNLEHIHDFKQSAPDHQTPEGNPDFGPKSCGYPVDTSGLWKFRNRSRKSAIPVFDLGEVGRRCHSRFARFLPIRFSALGSSREPKDPLDL
jgi:hypothetical protein